LSDGRTFNGSEASFTFAESGAYWLKLTQTNQAGCSSYADVSLRVPEQPIASFEADAVCQSEEMHFINTSAIKSGSITSVYWDFGDNKNSSVYQPAHLFEEAGEYPV